MNLIFKFIAICMSLLSASYVNAKPIDENSCVGNNNGQACVSASIDYFYGKNDVRKSVEKAIYLAKHGCSIKFAKACNNLGLMYRDLGDREKAFHYLYEATNLHFPRAYFHIGNLYLSAKPADISAAVESFKKGCLLDDGPSCATWALGEPKSAEPQLKKLCKNKVSIACYSLGNLAKQKEEAVKYYVQACNYGEGDACGQLSISLGNTANYEKALVYAKKGCELDDALSCRNASTALLNLGKLKHENLKDVYQEQLPYLEKACRLENQYCVALGELDLYLGKFNEGKDLLSKACAKNDAMGCSGLASIYEYGLGTSIDLKKAESLYVKTCDLDKKLCFNYARFQTDHGKTKKDVLGLFEKACKADEPESCVQSGLIYSLGQGIKKDLKVAEQKFTKACSLNHPNGCNLLGKLLLENPKTAAKGLEYQKKSCDLGSGDSCNDLGMAYHSGQVFKRDSKMAQVYFEKSCTLNFEQGCSNLGVLAAKNQDHKKASAYFKKACLLSKSGAPCNEWVKALWNIGGAENFAKAKEVLVDSCVKKSKTETCNFYGLTHLTGDFGSKVDLPKGVSILTKNCERNHPGSCAILAGHYARIDKQKSILFGEKACMLGHSNSCGGLGDNLIAQGNISKGISLLEKSCNNGANGDCVKLAMHLYTLPKPHQNVQKSLQLLEEVIALDDDVGKCMLAAIYSWGDKVPRDKNKAIKYIKMVKSKDNPMIQSMMASVYLLNGMNKQAIPLLENACSKKVPQACNMLKQAK